MNKYVLAPLLLVFFSSHQPGHIPHSLGMDEAARLLREEAVSERRFVEVYAAVVRDRVPDAKVEHVGQLELRITTEDVELSSYIDNFWLGYQQDTSSPEIRLSEFLESISDALERAREPEPSFDLGAVVPVVRSFELVEGMKSQGVPGLAAEHLVEDLWVLYAIDSPTGIRYSSWEDLLPPSGLAKDELRSAALENLRNLLPDIERHGDGPLFMISAGGNYEASLLLVHSIWESQSAAVPGDIVASVPTRDVLLFTGSDSAQGMEAIRQMTKKSFDGPYAVSSSLLRWGGGEWSPL